MYLAIRTKIVHNIDESAWDNHATVIAPDASFVRTSFWYVLKCLHTRCSTYCWNGIVSNNQRRCPRFRDGYHYKCRNHFFTSPLSPHTYTTHLFSINYIITQKTCPGDTLTCSHCLRIHLHTWFFHFALAHSRSFQAWYKTWTPASTNFSSLSSTR